MQESLAVRVLAGRFAIESLIGSGAMGAVYRARHVGLDKLVAVKVLHRDAASNPTFAARLEARGQGRVTPRPPQRGARPRLRRGARRPALHRDGAARRRRSPVAARARGAPGRGSHRRSPLPGARRARRRPQARDRAPRSEAGEHHDRPRSRRGREAPRDREGVRLRDRQDGADASADERRGGVADEPRGSSSGRPRTCPRSSAAASALDPRADIYSLGIVLYELLVGSPPFQADNVLDVLLKQVSQEPVPPSQLRPGVSAHLEHVCLTAMSKQRAKRYASAQEMRNALRETPGPRPERPRPDERRPPGRAQATRTRPPSRSSCRACAASPRPPLPRTCRSAPRRGWPTTRAAPQGDPSRRSCSASGLSRRWRRSWCTAARETKGHCRPARSRPSAPAVEAPPTSAPAPPPPAAARPRRR